MVGSASLHPPYSTARNGSHDLNGGLFGDDCHDLPSGRSRKDNGERDFVKEGH
jgi:hypothetical protein